MKTSLKAFLLSSIILLSLSLGFWGVQARQAPAGAATSTRSEARSENAAEIRQQTFDRVWQIVKEKHFDPTFNGVDWNAVRERYAPLVAAVKSDEELYPLLNKMVGELKQSHFSIIPPSELVDEVGGKERGDLGLDVRVIAGQLVIRGVAPKSAAERAGLKPGFIVTAIDEKTINDLSGPIVQRKESEQKTRSLLRRSVLNLMTGPIGSTSKVTFLDGGGQSHVVSIERQPLLGNPVKFANLPTMYLQFDTQRLANGVGYIRFNVFAFPVVGQFRTAMENFRDATGIVIDLRGNRGGIAQVASEVARQFCRERASLGTTKSRAGEQSLGVLPNSEAYQGPLIILTDEGTGSSAEVLAGGLQGLDRAVIVGQTSAGAVLPATTEKLPNGALFLFAIADYKTSKGLRLEGVGVPPDYEVPLTRESLLAGRDLALEKAVSIIESRRTNTKQHDLSQVWTSSLRVLGVLRGENLGLKSIALSAALSQ